MKCPQCQHENPTGAKFCNGCGGRLELVCQACSHTNPAGSRFCNDCGAALTPDAAKVPTTTPPSPETYTPKHLADKILTSKSALEGERKQVTVLFADLKGSLELLADRDPEESRTLLNAVVEHMMEAVHRYEGTVNNIMGDGIMATFGAPLAHEDHAMRACYAALRMQDAVGRYSDEVQRSQGIPVRIRVGLNSGEVVVGSVGDDLRMDYTVVGQTTHLAARMEQTAKPSSIMVSENTHKLTEGFFRFKDIGPVQVKGLSEAVNGYELQSVGTLRTRLDVSAQRGLVRFVGRQNEMEQMRRALDLARRNKGQIVGVMGDPGVGKSRLFYEFKILEQAECLVMEAFSVFHGKVYPYLPLIELLKHYFQIVLEDCERTRREKIAGKVALLDHSLADTLPYLFFLLGISESSSSLQQMDSQIRRQRTFEAIKRLILRESLNQPLLVVFEDLHWIDSETQAFLDMLSESVASARVLLLVNYRPEYRHSWGTKTYYTQLRLDALGYEDAAELLSALLGDDEAKKSLRSVILEKTQGNPFFMEEVVQTLVEEKALVGERGNYRLARSASGLQIPPTIQVALAARIDRLGAKEKGLLQTLAVIGRVFPMSLIREVVEDVKDELQRLLFSLQAGELIYEQPTFPEVEYVFKHALTREVAYNSILTDRRRALHERTARAIEALYADQLDEHYSELAHHYRNSENREKAVVYLNLAGQQAVQRSAHGEAIAHLTSALELLTSLPYMLEQRQQELELQTNLGLALMATRGYAALELERVYARARALCQQVPESPELFRVLWGLCIFYVVRAEPRAAREVGEQLFSLAQSQRNSVFPVEAHFTLAMPSYHLADFSFAREHFEQAIALYDRSKHHDHAFLFGVDLGVFSYVFAAHALWHLGHPDRALAMCHEGLDLAQDLSHPFSQAVALDYAAMFYQFCREDQLAGERAESAISICTEHGFAYYLAWGKILQGWALSELGKGKLGRAQMRDGVAALQATGGQVRMPYYLGLLAEAFCRAGQTMDGLNAIGRALDMVNKTEESWYEAELYRLKGELLLRSDISKTWEVESTFYRALDIARCRNAKFLELRASMSLSRLLHRQGKNDEARQILAEIYSWFNEGFDTPDLKDGKALLEELS